MTFLNCCNLCTNITHFSAIMKVYFLDVHVRLFLLFCREKQNIFLILYIAIKFEVIKKFRHIYPEQNRLKYSKSVSHSPLSALNR